MIIKMNRQYKSKCGTYYIIPRKLEVDGSIICDKVNIDIKGVAFSNSTIKVDKKELKQILGLKRNEKIIIDW